VFPLRGPRDFRPGSAGVAVMRLKCNPSEGRSQPMQSRGSMRRINSPRTALEFVHGARGRVSTAGILRPYGERRRGSTCRPSLGTNASLATRCGDVQRLSYAWNCELDLARWIQRRAPRSRRLVSLMSRGAPNIHRWQFSSSAALCLAVLDIDGMPFRGTVDYSAATADRGVPRIEAYDEAKQRGSARR
jgi:hypothetical protein